MTDERYEQLMRDAARTYNRAPDEPPFDAMWKSIERSTRGQQWEELDRTHARLGAPQRKPGWFAQPWLRTAAVLILGIGIGRASFFLANGAGSPETIPVAAANRDQPGMTVPHQYESVTDDYLGQTAALLIALPRELQAKRSDSSYVTRADDLLLQTRLLLDSPAAADPALRALFEDLEIVLAQVVRLQADRDPTKVDLLNQALEQRDVILRLRSAVADHIAD